MRSFVQLVPLTLLVARPPWASFTYTVPAEYTLPDRVTVLAVVDLPEKPESDAAADAMVDVLTNAPNLKVIAPAAARQALAATPLVRGEPLGAEKVQAVTKGASASGVLALDRVEVADDVTFEERVETTTQIVRERPAGCTNCKPEEKEVQIDKPVVYAHRTATVTTGWQVYAADGSLLTSWATTASAMADGKGDDPTEARTNAGNVTELARSAASVAGAEAAKHIAPWTNTATRRYFKCGDSNLRAGHKLAKRGDWEGAVTAWKVAAESEDAKVRGKAKLDLAVAAERRGDVARAQDLAAEAAKLLDKDWVRAYAKVLKAREKEEARLADQLGTDVKGPKKAKKDKKGKGGGAK